MLQVRCAHPTGAFAPKRPFGTFRCFAWLIKTREHTVLSLSQTLMLQVRCAHPSGVFAPKRLFKSFRCCGRLFFHKEYAVLFAPKRSTFRFASLTLRVSSHRNAPSEHSSAKGTGEPKARHSPSRIVILTGLWSEYAKPKSSTSPESTVTLGEMRKPSTVSVSWAGE